MLSRFLQPQQNMMNESESSKSYDKLIMPNSNAKFVYERGTRYIRLTQEKVGGDGFYPDYAFIPEDNQVIKSFLLDENLAIIWEGTSCRNFEEELINFQKSQLTENENKDKSPQESLPKLSFQTGIFQIPNVSLAPIDYRVFPSVNDFAIGRFRFVRNFQSHKISSDSISKQHCEISHFKSNNAKVSTYLKTITKILTTRSPKNSKLRKIPYHLWFQIFEYLKPRQKYSITDLGSRNGTWISQIGTQICRFQQNFDYQFQNESYSIHISKIYTSLNSQSQQILQHNRKAHKILQQFKKQVNWNYYERANKIMIVQDVENIATKQDEKIQILIFKLKYRDYHEYYLLAVNQSFKKKYTVGCKFDIDVNPEEYDSPSLHGRIYIDNGRWMIESFELKRNGEPRKIWTRLAKNYKYVLDTHKHYKIRLGTMFNMSLEFENF